MLSVSVLLLSGIDQLAEQFSASGQQILFPFTLSTFITKDETGRLTVKLCATFMVGIKVGTVQFITPVYFLQDYSYKIFISFFHSKCLLMYLSCELLYPCTGQYLSFSTLLIWYHQYPSLQKSST